MYGPNWPMNGEIDIIEGVNSQQSNSMALHTGPGCSINNVENVTGAGNAVETERRGFSGSIITDNCDVHAPGQGTNVGCTITTSDSTTYGDGFNNDGGGVYAMEWTAEAISIFHFSRINIPSDLNSESPNPSLWGVPLAVFHGCNFRDTIANQSLVFDVTFCGDWAGQDAVWKADPICSEEAATCQDYVARNPAAFANSFWEINSLKVYQQVNNDSVVAIASTKLQSQTNRTTIAALPQTRPVETDGLLGTPSTSVSPYLAPTSARAVQSLFLLRHGARPPLPR